MGANYLLGGEEQEGWALLRLEENTPAWICFREGKINQSRENQLSSQTHMKLTFHVKFYCLALKIWVGFVNIGCCSDRDLLQVCRKTPAPPCGHSFTQQSSFKTTTRSFDEDSYVCCFLAFAFISAPRLLSIVNHSIIFSFPPIIDYPPLPKKQN